MSGPGGPAALAAEREIFELGEDPDRLRLAADDLADHRTAAAAVASGIAGSRDLATALGARPDGLSDGDLSDGLAVTDDQDGGSWLPMRGSV